MPGCPIQNLSEIEVELVSIDDAVTKRMQDEELLQSNINKGSLNSLNLAHVLGFVLLSIVVARLCMSTFSDLSAQEVWNRSFYTGLIPLGLFTLWTKFFTWQNEKIIKEWVEQDIVYFSELYNEALCFDDKEAKKAAHIYLGQILANMINGQKSYGDNKNVRSYVLKRWGTIITQFKG